MAGENNILIFFKLAVRNLFRHRTRTILLAGLIIIGVGVFFTANSMFEGTKQGLERALVNSLTGDAVLSASDGGNVSLFGNEIPIISEYESILALTSYPDIVSELENIPSLSEYTSIVSTVCQMNIGGSLQSVPVFGIDPDTYFNVCSDLKIEWGDVKELNEKGVFLNSEIAEKIEASIGRGLKKGESVQFRISDGQSFRLRTAPLLGVFSYPASNEMLDRVILADLVTVRSLANFTLGYGEIAAEEEPSDADFDMDSLFSDAEDVTADEEVLFDFEGLEEELSDTASRDEMVLTDNGAWNFILLKAVDNKRTELMREIKKRIVSKEIDANLLSWRRAAGNSALSIFAVQTLFNIGLGFLSFGVVLVIMNSLVISVFERTSEIGTMRSLGAQAGFIRKQFIVESLLLTVGASLAGLFSGSIAVFILKQIGIELGNPLLISLFGGSVLQLKITATGILSQILLSISIGALAWIYPVNLAMKVQPISAMNSE